jgi:hypothetical protein
MVSRCVIQNIVSESNIAVIYSHNVITGAATFEHCVNGSIENNVFVSAVPAADLFLNDSIHISISDNEFHCGPGATAINLLNSGHIAAPGAGTSAPITILNNTITFSIPSNTNLGINVRQTSTGKSNITILNNRIDTNGGAAGLQLSMAIGDDDHFRAMAQGNDFHNNAWGVFVVGDGTTCGNIDLGAGALGSLGGNNFRGFPSPADQFHAAILLVNATNGLIFAVQNVFSNNVAASSVVFAHTGVINVGGPLSPDQSFVQALYNEVLGRTGTLDELRPWANLLASQGRATVANGIRLSPEALGRVVDQLYLRFLGRQSDTGGRAGWINFLRSGGTLEQVETLFLTSPEYLGHINTEFVQSLYLNILGRAGSPAELALWNNNIQNLGLAGIADGFVRSPEHRTNTVRSFFQTFLHRTPSNTELAPLVNTTQTLLDLEGTVSSSDEFFANG